VLDILQNYWTQARNQGESGTEPPLQTFSPPPGKICWAQLETFGHSLKNLCLSQKTLRHPWCPKLVRAWLDIA